MVSKRGSTCNGFVVRKLVFGPPMELFHGSNRQVVNGLGRASFCNAWGGVGVLLVGDVGGEVYFAFGVWFFGYLY